MKHARTSQLPPLGWHPMSQRFQSLETLPAPPPMAMKEVEDVRSLQRMILGQGSVAEPGRYIGTYVALDCEMVGVGPSKRHPAHSALGRVTLVNYNGQILLDTFVRPQEKVTDYRTAVSGIRAEDLSGPYARPFSVVRSQVEVLIRNRILIGHALHNDLACLRLSHPENQIKDTQRCPSIQYAYSTHQIGLRRLVLAEFGLDIQSGEHSSATDARAAMAVYRMYRDRWTLDDAYPWMRPDSPATPPDYPARYVPIY